MTKRPQWISKNEDGKDSVRCADPDLTVELAKYGCLTGYRFQSDTAFPLKPSNSAMESRAMLVAMAMQIQDAHTLSEWSYFGENYPNEAMDPSELKEQHSSTVAVRALYLRRAVCKLLAVVGAPSAMATDLDMLLSTFVPQGAESRGRVQQAILDDPGVSLQQIATRAKASPGQISKDGKAGLLFWPADPVGSDPPGSK